MARQKKYSRQISVNIESEIDEALKAEALNEGLDVSDIVRRFITAGLADLGYYDEP